MLAGCGEDPAPAAIDEPPVVAEAAPARYEEAVPGTDVVFTMVRVPGHGFWIARTEVTWDAYEAYFLAKDAPDGADAVARPSSPYLPHDQGWGTGRRPAIGISRHAAEHYCQWLSRKTGRTYRLPTEPEWVAACKAGGAGSVAERAWTRANSDGMTHEVGSRAADALGLHDMWGNAWEYCRGTIGEKTEPVMRGGCWDTPPQDVGCEARRGCPAAWNESDPNRPRGVWWLADGPYVGFRVVREIRR